MFSPHIQHVNVVHQPLILHELALSWQTFPFSSTHIVYHIGLYCLHHLLFLIQEIKVNECFSSPEGNGFQFSGEVHVKLRVAQDAVAYTVCTRQK